jgi:phosphohistidine phosphatase
MKLLIVRHAAAMDRGTPGLADELRPLTEEGIARFGSVARALRSLAEIDVLLSSPLLRAKQTAEIMAGELKGVRVTECAALGGASREEVEDALSRLPVRSSIALVGHEPALSEWASDWLSARHSPAFAFKKGGAALLECEGYPEAGSCGLVWWLPPKILRRLGE